MVLENGLSNGHAETSSKETPMKYILVTGGVISGVGKGIISSSIGVLLKNNGYRVGTRYRLGSYTCGVYGDYCNT